MITNHAGIERADVVAFVRAEAARMRGRNEHADQAVAAHFEILADQLEREEHLGARRVGQSEGNGPAIPEGSP